MDGWKTQLASGVQRDGLGLELLDHRQNIVAEVFRCDADHTVIVNTFGNEIPLTALEWFLEYARYRIGAFEDGTPLPATDATQ